MFVFSSKKCQSHGFSKNCAYVLLACMYLLYTIGTLCTYVSLFWRGHDVLDAALVKGGGKDSQKMNNFYWLSDLSNLNKVVPVYMNDVPVQNFNCYSQIFNLITYMSYISYKCHIYDMKVWQILAATLTAASHDWKACELSLTSVLGCRKQCGVNRNRKRNIFAIILLPGCFENYQRDPTWIILFYQLLPSNPVGNTTSS